MVPGHVPIPAGTPCGKASPHVPVSRFDGLLVRADSHVQGGPPGSDRARSDPLVGACGKVSTCSRCPRFGLSCLVLKASCARSASASRILCDDRLLQVREAGADLRGGCRRQQLRPVHEAQPVAPLPLVEVGRGDEDGHPFFTHPAEDLPELLAGDGIDAVRRFVEDQEFRLVDEDAGEAQFLLHPAGELSRRPVREGEEVGEAEVEGLPRLALRAADSEDVHEKVDVLLDRQILIEAETLGHVADPVLDGRPVGDDVQTVDRDPARGGFEHRRRHPEQGGLSRPVGADEAEDRPPFDRERDVADRLGRAETAGDSLDPDERIACGFDAISSCAERSRSDASSGSTRFTPDWGHDAASCSQFRSA